MGAEMNSPAWTLTLPALCASLPLPMGEGQ